MAGLFLMLIAAPVAAAVFSFGACVIGVTLDDMRHDRGRPALGPDRTAPLRPNLG
jgi:hypothetical protein